MTPTLFLSLVRARAVALLVTAAHHKGKDLTYDQAEKIAAQEVIREERERRRQSGTTINTGSAWDGTLKTAAAEFVRRIDSIAERFKEAAALGLDRRAITATPNPPVVTAPRVTPRVSRNKSNLTAPVKSPAPELTGVFVGNTASAQLIPDSEFAPSHHDHVTANWRKSIEDNARVEQERREAWLRRLEERRARS
jgi:hypothetical protein